MKINSKYDNLILFLILFLLIFFAIYYINIIKALLNEESRAYLKELSHQAQQKVEEKIESKFELLTALAIRNNGVLKQKANNIEILQDEIIVESGFDKILFIANDGIATVKEGNSVKKILLNDKKYFIEASQGRNYLSEKIDDSIVYAVPVYDGQKIIGVLCGFDEVKYLVDNFNYSLFNGMGYVFLLDHDGTVLWHFNPKYIDGNFLEFVSINSLELIEPTDVSSWQKDIFEYIINGNKRYCGRVPIKSKYGDTGINLMVSMPYDYVFERTNIITNITTQFFFTLIFISFLGLAYIGYVKYKNNKEIEQKAFYDEYIKSLYNRNGFLKESEVLLRENRNKLCLCLNLDIDDFKLINNLFGHDYGNMVLNDLAQELKNVFKTNAIISKSSVDEFTLLIFYEDVVAVVAKVKLFMNNMEKKYKSKFDLNLAVGLYFLEDNKEKIENIITKANIARKSIKYSKRSLYAVYDESLAESIKNEVWLAKELQKAIANDELELYYQPEFDLYTEKIISAESFVRWYHPLKGRIQTKVFVNLAEKLKMNIELDKWILAKVCSDLAKWREEGCLQKRVSIKFGRRSLYNKEFILFLKEKLKQYSIRPEMTGIEIREDIVGYDVESAQGILNDLRNLGIKIILDDFGIGYSSLSIIQKIPIDIMKIDKTFLNNIKEKNGVFLLETIINIAKNLGIKIVCEGIETAEQIEILQGLKCDYGQGFFYSKALSEETYKNMFLIG